MIAHDIEIIKENGSYRLSDNPFTFDALRVVAFNVEGAGYERTYDNVEGVNGRFYNSSTEEYKKVEVQLRYEVDKIAYASHLKTGLQNLLSGHFYLRELATPDNTIQFEDVFASNSTQKFELEYVDGRQIYVGLTSQVSFDTTKTSGDIALTFETVDLPYFESIGYSMDLEQSPYMEKWAVPDEIPFNEISARRKYTFTDVNYGDVYYNGDVPINQFNQDSLVLIELGKPVKKDDDNGFTFYTDKGNIAIIKGIELKAGDIIKFDGLHTYRNDIKIDNFNETLEQPVLVPGFNRFRCNQTVRKIAFKHKIYFR